MPVHSDSRRGRPRQLVTEGVDRYGNSSWPTSLAVAALFGVFFAVRWRRSGR